MENSPGWFEAACKAFQYEKKCVIAAYDMTHTNLVAVVPLVKVRLYGIHAYAAPGLDFVTHAAILGDLRDNALRQELIATMEKLGTIHLKGLMGEDAYGLAQSSNNVSLFPSDRESVIDFAYGPFGEFPKRQLRVLRNRIKRSPEPMGAPVAANPVEALQTCFDIDQASVKHQKGKGVFWRDGNRAFYTLLAEKYPSRICITILLYGSKPIAYDMCFHYKDTYIGSQKAYLPEYAYYKPGYFIFITFIEEVSRHGPVHISLGGGYDQFKHEFTKQSRVLFGAVVSTRALSRLFLACMLRARERIYRIVVAYPKIYANYKRLKESI